jgi:cytochrome c oxidase subunit 2
MEIVYTALPILMVGGLFAVTYPAERHVEAIAAAPQLVVNVTAFRWSWRFDYPRTGTSIVGTPSAPPELVLPLNETVRLNVTSVDVDHSFWVPAFLFKRDAIPGVENVFDWTPNRLGTFRGECGEFCGLDHALMSFSVKVVTPVEFEHWLKKRRPLAAADAKTVE